MARLRALRSVLALLPLAALALAATAPLPATPPPGLDPAWEESRRRIASALQSTPVTLLIEGPKEPEIRHTEMDIVRSRRLLQTTGQAPVCEMNLAYAVRAMAPDGGGFNASVTLSNNRELGSSWQLVYRFADFSKVALAGAAGATVLTAGSPRGAPVRLVDEFSLESSGIPGGGNYTFTLQAAFIGGGPAGANDSLGIERVNFNGLACSQITPLPGTGALLPAGPCGSALSFFSAFAGSAGSRAAVEACQATFCCGFILEEPGKVEAPAPEVPPELPEVQEPNPALLLPLPPSEPEPPDVGASDGPPVVGDDNTQQDTPKDVTSLPEGSAGKESIGPLLGGVVAAAVALAAAVVTTAWWIRRRRRLSSTPYPGGPTHLALKRAGPAVDVAASAGGTGTRRGSGSTLASKLTPVGARATLTMQRVTSGALGSSSGTGPSTAGTISSASDGGACTLPDDEPLPQEVVLYEQLGAGAFGTVYRGEWAGRVVAVKVLQTACASGSNELASFRQEVAVLSRLRHPNIIAFLAACTVPPDICIIEEIAEGGSLHATLHGTRGARRCSPLPLRHLLGVATDVAAAMAYLHPRIVHRDLKSQNVLLDAAGRAKVADFGIAKFKEKTLVSTVNGQAGTPSYMAPELFDGGPITEKVDIYSYGVLLWECLSGQVPWGAVPSPMQIIYYVGVLGQRPPMPAACPPGLGTLIEACWSERPADRPGFKEVLQRLEVLRQEMEAAGTGDLVMEAPPPAPEAPEGAGGGAVGTESAVGTGSTLGPSTLGGSPLHSYNSMTTGGSEPG